VSISGAFLEAKIGASPVVLPGVQEWTVEEEVEELDRSSGASGGKGDRDAGIGDATITMRLFQDTTTGVYAVIKAGTVLTDLILFRNSGDTDPAFSFPTALVIRSGNPVRVRGGVYLDITAKNKGTYTTNDPGAS
jgi:hypothetical protein